MSEEIEYSLESIESELTKINNSLESLEWKVCWGILMAIGVSYFSYKVIYLIAKLAN